MSRSVETQIQLLPDLPPPEVVNIETADITVNNDTSIATTVNSNSASTETPTVGSTQTQSGSSVREIYKNGWLKLIPNVAKKTGKIYKTPKPEKFWFVFCVHDEKEAFLELYENRRSAYSHTTTSVISLSQCLHISPTIVIQDNDYEFVITLENQVVRLAASTRDHMVEWMDTIRNKLRELKILQPKDNVYSREPITGSKLPSSNFYISTEGLNEEADALSLSASHLSIRDPNSPLPPVPLTTRLNNNNNNDVTQPNNNSNLVPIRILQIPPHSTEPSNTHRVSGSDSSGHAETPSPTSNLLINLSFNDEQAREDNVFHNNSPMSPQNTTTLPGINSEVQGTDTSVYETLFCQVTLNTNRQPRVTAVQNPSYETMPDPFTLLDSAPQLPIRNPDRRQRSQSLASEGNLNRDSGQSQNGLSLTSSLEWTSNDSVITDGRNRESSSSASDDILQHDQTRTSSVGATNNNHGMNDQNSQIPRTSTNEENKPPLALRQAQVQKLQAEITHKSGVRIILRKKDCVNAVAFVDCFASVWIAGWKQKEHPLLHNKFHVGDRVLSIAGHEVHTVQEILRAIKLQHGLVEFVVRRTPYAKVLAIKREYDGQDLGIVREGGTGEIREISPGSLIARHGLPAKAPTVDGTSLCNWYLTEINQRPLSLFFKENEIHDRLNAVGLDISILVQPMDFVKTLKKQLKTIRGYKEYTVQ